MDTIGNLWWLWLLGVLTCYGYAIANQLLRIKKITNLDLVGDPMDTFSRGLLYTVASGFLGSGFGILLLLSILINVAQWAK